MKKNFLSSIMNVICALNRFILVNVSSILVLWLLFEYMLLIDTSINNR